MKKAVAILLVLGFLATVPALYQNQRKVAQVEKEVVETLDFAKAVCDSDCTDYPQEWVDDGNKEEAEAYCRSQCEDDMKGMRDALLDDFPTLFTSQYNYRVAQLYCVLGLVCPQLQITNVIEDYSR